MKTPAFPPDEEARLTSLHSLKLLDTSPEERFDRITRMAKRLFGVPIALVSLVDANRQWFKSCFGLSASETSRDISFCGHAILGHEIFVIPDALADPRFADNPLVTDAPHIRFYAGCPLKAPDGHKIGTLCIIDQKARHFSAEDHIALSDLARMVEQAFTAAELSTLDEVTTLSNRRGFLQLGQYSLDFCLRQKLAATLICIGIKDLALITEAFGPSESEHVLSSFAEIMRQGCRDSDVFGRTGKDEFAILLTNTRASQAGQLAMRLKDATDRYNALARRDYNISFLHDILDYIPGKSPRIDDLLSAGEARLHTLIQLRSSD